MLRGIFIKMAEVFAQADFAWGKLGLKPETKWANVQRYQLILARERKEESRPVACANYQHLNGRNRGRNIGSGGGVMAEEWARYCQPGRLQNQSILGIFQPSWCDTLQVRKAYGLSAPNVLTLTQSLEAHHTAFCWADQH